MKIICLHQHCLISWQKPENYISDSLLHELRIGLQKKKLYIHKKSFVNKIV